MELLTPIQPVKLPSHHSSPPKKNNTKVKNSGRSTLQNITNANNNAVQNGNRTKKFAYVEKKTQAEKDSLKQSQGAKKALNKPSRELKEANVPLVLPEFLELEKEKEEVAVVLTTPSSSSLDSDSPSSPPALVSSCSPPSPNKSNEKKTLLQYDREFLLSFKDKPCCKQTPPGKLPSEIIEEYNQECNQKEKQQLFLHPNAFAPFSKEKKEWKPKSQVQAINKEKKEEEKPQIKKQVPQVPQVPQLPLRNLGQQNYSPIDDEDEDDFGPSQELNQRRLETRQRQIDIGKNTPGYQNYIRSVPKEQRKRGDPQTPHKHQICSKRSWDGQIRKWRRMLHLYDPEQTPSTPPKNSSSQP